MSNPTSYNDNGFQFGAQTAALVTGYTSEGAEVRSIFVLKAFSLTRGTNFLDNSNTQGNPNAQHGHLTRPTGSATCQLSAPVKPIQLTEFIAEEVNGDKVGLVISEVGQSIGNDAERSVTINIRAVTHPMIASKLTASGTEGTAFTYTTTCTVADFDSAPVFTATGLPTGLSIDAATGVISGTPTTSGTTSVTLGVSRLDEDGNTISGAATLTITIAAEP